MAEVERLRPEHIRLFLSSPGDVAEERELARGLIKDELPVDPLLRDHFTFDIVSWDDPAAPTPMPAGITPQEAVNRFGPRPSACDIVVVILWSRLGTHLDVSVFRRPDGEPYLSGTEWEFDDAWGATPRPEILVYRRTEKPRTELDDPQWEEKRLQYERVAQFMKRFANPNRSLRGGWTDYNAPKCFRDRLVKDLRRLLRERLEAVRLVAEKGVPMASLRAVLIRYGEHEDVPEHEIIMRLERWAEEFAAVRSRLERLTNDRPEAGAARRRATALLEAGDLDGAQAVLSNARQSLRESRQQTAREEATILADEARVHRLRLDYATAATALAEAAGLVVGFDAELAWRYTLGAADALVLQGEEFGNKDPLRQAIEMFRGALALAPRESRPEDWAETQTRLGNALGLLGVHEKGVARFEEAVAACRAALGGVARERVPLQWARTQVELGNALRNLGWYQAGTARLEEAVAAFHAAFEELTRERAPADWARAQTELGVTLGTMGEREEGAARLEEAVAAFQAALTEYTRERTPFEWARAQEELAVTFSHLGKREEGTARLEESVAAFHEALGGLTRAQAPLQWARTQEGLGNVLAVLGDREESTTRLEEAVDALRAALEERTRERVPRDWASTQNNLGLALLWLGKREDGTARLEGAVEACRAALQEFTRERDPVPWAQISDSVAEATAEIGSRTGDRTRLQEALGYAEDSVEVLTTAGAPHLAAVACKQRDAIRAKLAGAANGARARLEDGGSRLS